MKIKLTRVQASLLAELVHAGWEKCWNEWDENPVSERRAKKEEKAYELLQLIRHQIKEEAN